MCTKEYQTVNNELIELGPLGVYLEDEVLIFDAKGPSNAIGHVLLSEWSDPYNSNMMEVTLNRGGGSKVSGSDTQRSISIEWAMPRSIYTLPTDQTIHNRIQSCKGMTAFIRTNASVFNNVKFSKSPELIYNWVLYICGPSQCVVVV